MPVYTFTCPSCASREERYRPMAEAGRPARCRRCGGVMERDWRADRPRVGGGATFRPYEACSGGVPEHVMEEAFREKGNWYVRRKGPDGRMRPVQINPPGFDLNPHTGDVIIPTPQARKRYLEIEQLHDLRDTVAWREKTKHLSERLAEARRRRREQSARERELRAEAARHKSQSEAEDEAAA